MSDSVSDAVATRPVVRLSGDVARNFAHLPPHQAAEAVATHLTKFWEWRMVRELVTLARAGEPGLDPLVLDAVRDVLAAQVDEQQLREPSGG